MPEPLGATHLPARDERTAARNATATDALTSRRPRLVPVTAEKPERSHKEVGWWLPPSGDVPPRPPAVMAEPPATPPAPRLDRGAPLVTAPPPAATPAISIGERLRTGAGESRRRWARAVNVFVGWMLRAGFLPCAAVALGIAGAIWFWHGGSLQMDVGVQEVVDHLAAAALVLGIGGAGMGWRNVARGIAHDP